MLYIIERDKYLGIKKDNILKVGAITRSGHSLVHSKRRKKKKILYVELIRKVAHGPTNRAIVTEDDDPLHYT